MKTLAEIQVFKDRDNTDDLEISTSDGLTDFSGVTKAELIDTNGQWSCSTTEDADFITFTKGQGIVTFKLGASAVPVGDSTAWLVVYDAVNTAGIVIGPFSVIAR